MKKQRLNTEKKIDNDYFNLTLGSINRLEPRAVYLEGTTFITPKSECDEEEYIQQLKTIRVKLKREIANTLTNGKLFDQRFIFNFDCASSGLKPKKRSYLSFQVLMKQPNENLKYLKELKDSIEDDVNRMLNSFVSTVETNNFSLFRKR